MDNRVYNNLIAVLIVLLILSLMLVLAGCSSIKMERQDGANYEKITVRAPPKNFTSLDFNWHNTRLKAGEAATSEAWADVVGDYSGLLLNVNSYCRAYPSMCQTEKSWVHKSAGGTNTNCSATMDQNAQLTLWENGVPMAKVNQWCMTR